MAGPVSRIIRFVGVDGEEHFGDASGVADVLSMSEAEVLSGDLYGTLERSGKTVGVAKLLSPVEPCDIFCIGLNYKKHYEECSSWIEKPELPAIFMKGRGSLNHPGGDIWMPQLEKGQELDWEVELAIVIGKKCRNVSAEEALDYVLGFTVANDVTSRHWQKNAGAGQWIKGKSFDTFCPMGPVLVRCGTFDHQSVRLQTRVNGATMQDSHTSDMIFTCAECIAWLSKDTTLHPGTVILTGTPEGVGVGKKPPVFMKVGVG